MKNNNQESDIDAIAYSGLVSSIIGVMLFLVRTDTGHKLFNWEALAMFILVTAIAFALKKAQQRY